MDKQQCSATVYPKEQWGAFHGHGCARKATIERDGKWYCGLHDPVNVKLREDKNSLIANAKWEEANAKRRIELHGSALLAMLEKILPEYEMYTRIVEQRAANNASYNRDLTFCRDHLAQAKELIAKAKGG